MSGEAEFSLRRKTHRVVGGEKGTEVIYFCLLSVCILIICAGPYAGFGAACLAVLFILRPDRKTVRSRRSRRPSGALFWRAFSADERRLWAYFARNVPSLCHLQTIQRPRARSAVLCSLLQTDRRGSHRLLSFLPRSLSNAVRFILAVQSSAFAACPYFYSGNAVPPFGFPLSYYAGVHTETSAGRCAPQGGLCADSYVFFARLTSAFRAKPVLPLRRAGAVGCFT